MKNMTIFLIISTVLLHWQCSAKIPVLTSPSQSQVCGNLSRPDLLTIISDQVNPTLTDRYGPEGGLCGSRGWKKVASLNMSQTNETCPSDWTRIAEPFPACKRVKLRQASATIATRGNVYSLVCGRIIAYQVGGPDAFKNAFHRGLDSIEESYIDGVSITHGPEGLRQHIWSFVAGAFETSLGTTQTFSRMCPCSVEEYPFRIPSFVAGNYFCDSANLGPSVNDTEVYVGRSLWSGEGCAPTSKCCQFNQPPYFYTLLPKPTSDDLEIRIMVNTVKTEDIYITVLELYVQ